MRIHPMLCRSTFLCLATALAPIGAPLLHAQDVQNPVKTHHDGHKKHKEGKAHHGKRKGHAETGVARDAGADRRMRRAEAAHSTAPEHLQVVGFKRAAKADALGTIEEARLVQKNAPNIVLLMPQSEIEKIPNFVLGDAMRRMPGASIIFKSGESRALQVRGLDSSLNGVMFEGVLLPAGSMSSTGAGDAVRRHAGVAGRRP